MPTKFAMRLLAGTAVSALLTGVSFAAEAEARPFDIPQQDAATALQAFAMQSGRQVLFPYEAARGKQAPEIKGDYSDEDVIALLAASAGLKVTADDGRTVTLRPQFAQAAEAGGADGTVEALIVTAQKREEDIQDVPIAISAFTQEDLTRSQVAGGPDLMTQVPNFTFTKTNFSSYSIQIRGIGTQAISATVDPAVAVAFNNTPFIRNRFFEQEFYDLARIEVLRGPQGTLYGRNATAGVVNIISAKPSFRYEAKVSGDIANYDTTRLEGMINIPLVEDKVALRLAGAWTKREGYATNELTGNPIDGRDLWSTRLSLRVEPNDRISANLIWEHFEEDDDRLRSGKQLCKKDLRTEVGGVPIPDSIDYSTPATTFSQGCAPVSLYSDEAFQTPNGHSLPYYGALRGLGLPTVGGLDPYLNATQSKNLRVIESTLDPKYRAKSDLGELQLSFDLSDQFTLVSETAYSRDFIWSMQDYNRFTTTPGAFGEPWTTPREGLLNDGVYCDPQLGCSDRVLAADLSTAKSRQFSQELRLSSDFDGAFNFSLGANALRYDTEDKYYVFINTLTLTTASLNLYQDPPAPWVAGVSDNHECLYNLQYGDATQLQNLGSTNCWYIDPNPIESVNDHGHNYFLSRNPYKLISYAVFGEGYYEVTPNLKVTAGLRWTVDKKEAPEIPSWLLAPNTLGYPVLSVVRQEWREPTGRLTVDWKPALGFTDETLLYASYARGYKAGGANPPPTTVISYAAIGAETLDDSLTHPKTFEAEYVDAFELGAKNTMLDGRVTLNANVFYYDYKGYQISHIVDRAAINDNFDAKVWGAEIEADWRPWENLRLGFKGGYENTRVADGMRAIDLMDRTAGNPLWVVAKPFPTVPSNCILPVYTVVFGDQVVVPGGYSYPNEGPCLKAYQQNLDPVTGLEYVENPQTYIGTGGSIQPIAGSLYEGYRGFDPSTAPNNGEGFAKDLSGNELPNAPHFTATLTVDYTVPLPNEWLMTLHADAYWQSEAWARIFNFDPYDRLKPFTQANVAAIFTNEDAGWQVMAYVKNVFDKDNITGAFLNSDDTGLTTNVFLNEPRLYGLRVSKQWSDLPWRLGARTDGGPYPLTVELGGSIPRQDADNDPFTVDELGAFSPALLPGAVQQQDLDWGDGREVRLTFAPPGPWRLAAGVRFGKANAANNSLFSEQVEEGVCGHHPILCALFPDAPGAMTYAVNSSWVEAARRDDYVLADFSVGRDVGLGGADIRSSVSAGLAYARLTSETMLHVKGIPDWDLETGFRKYDNSTHHWYDGSVAAERQFEGAGPVLTWEASKLLLGSPDAGQLDLSWSVGAGVLFGKQTVDVHGSVLSNSYVGHYDNITYPHILLDSDTLPVSRSRSKSVSVPTVNLGLGLEYSVDRFKIGAGYRWERYVDAIDGGDRERQTFDRTIDGPYFKLAVGFGG